METLQNPAITSADKESGALSRRLNSPIFGVERWLSALRIDLRRSWHCSKFRLVAGDDSTPLGIAAGIQNRDLRGGPAIPSPRQCGQMSLGEESICVFACSSDIEGLSKDKHRAGSLDQALAAKAHPLGAKYPICILDSCKQSANNVQSQSFGGPS